MKNSYKFRAEVWLYPAEHATWHFVTLPKKLSTDLKKKYEKVKRGWGSLPIEVTVGKTTWQTSIFPDKRLGAYVLPIKAGVRKKEGMRRGDTAAFTLRVRA
jgi:hypothetical protein